MKDLIWAMATVAVFGFGPAHAQSQDEVLAAELLPGWQMENGHHMAGLRLQLAPSWKTYWRAPGEAGIPPLFNWSGSENVRSIRIHWPSPSVFHTNGMQTIGYHDAVVLPLEVTPRDSSLPVVLRAQVDLGVCKDICMPATIVVEAALTNPGTGGDAIRAALKSRPKSASEGGVTGLSCAVEPIADGLRVTATITMPFKGDVEGDGACGGRAGAQRGAGRGLGFGCGYGNQFRRALCAGSVGGYRDGAATGPRGRGDRLPRALNLRLAQPRLKRQ